MKAAIVNHKAQVASKESLFYEALSSTPWISSTAFLTLRLGETGSVVRF